MEGQRLRVKGQRLELEAKVAERLNLKNVLAAPRVIKVVVNVGLNASNKDPKIPEIVQSVLARITGQKPVATKAKKSISNFKIREGQVVGYKVTLRGQRMQDFVDKLIRVVLPRVRDFRGIPETMIDRRGNLSVGFREYIAFPEIRSDEIEKLHGLEVTITTDARDRDRGLVLFRALGIPLQRK